MDDLSDLSMEKLDSEFDRLATLLDECQEGMRKIREEKGRRLDEEIASLKTQLPDA